MRRDPDLGVARDVANRLVHGRHDAVPLCLGQIYCQMLCMRWSGGDAVLASSIYEFGAANDLGELI